MHLSRSTNTVPFTFHHFKYTRDVVNEDRNITLGSDAPGVAMTSLVTAFPEVNIDHLLIRICSHSGNDYSRLWSVKLLISLDANPMAYASEAIVRTIRKDDAHMLWALLQRDFYTTDYITSLIRLFPHCSDRIRKMLYQKHYTIYYPQNSGPISTIGKW